MGKTLDFRTESEKNLDKLGEMLNSAEIENMKDKVDNINQNLNDLENAETNEHIEDVKDATSNIKDILDQLGD